MFNFVLLFERGRKKKFERGRKEEKIYEKMNYYYVIKLLIFLIFIFFIVSVTLFEYLFLVIVRCFRCGVIRFYLEFFSFSFGFCSNLGIYWVF